MRMIVFGSLVALCVSTALSDQPAEIQAKFATQSAKSAMETFKSKLAFLDEKMAEQIDLAKKQLRSDLEKSAQLAVENKDFTEVQLISSFLQSKEFGTKIVEPIPTPRVLADLKYENARMKSEISRFKKNDPIVGLWNYNNGNICDYASDGTVTLKGKIIAIWHKTGDATYIVAFVSQQAADRLQILADGRTVVLTGPKPKEKQMRLDRIGQPK